MIDKIKILWADDEIDLLKPQLFFLEKKGYEVTTVSNGHDALDILDEDKEIDIVFLDESMPGLSGLETLSRIKAKLPNIPIVMITKNEAENIMEEAIGSQIDDYLIKPVNPNQILLTLKKIVDNKRLVSLDIPHISKRELEILQLMVRGLNSPQIAESLFLSYHTVENHKRNLRQKTKTKTAAELIDYVWRNNLI